MDTTREGGTQPDPVGEKSVLENERERPHPECVKAALSLGLVDPRERTLALIEAVDNVRMHREPVPMRLPCPSCGSLHVDEGEFATKVHHTHACQECGEVWRPAVIPTVGVRFLPGFKNVGPPGSREDER